MTIGTDGIIAVVGAGTMGAGIALVAAQAGHQVRVIDTQDAALERGRQTTAKSLASLVKRGTTRSTKPAPPRSPTESAGAPISPPPPLRPLRSKR
jgi:3-hydroxyacyl-CoA dehydrogenase